MVFKGKPIVEQDGECEGGLTKMRIWERPKGITCRVTWRKEFAKLETLAYVKDDDDDDGDDDYKNTR